MTIQLDAFLSKLPEIEKWILDLLESHEDRRELVSDFNFQRLNDYFQSSLLERSYAIRAEPPLPFPPLAAMGLSGFEEMEELKGAGIAYLDHFFVLDSSKSDESLFFHELIHVVQWQTLGPRRFILGYALGHRLNDYDNNPFEQVAYALQDRFDKSKKPFDAQKLTIQSLEKIEKILLPHFGGSWPL